MITTAVRSVKNVVLVTHLFQGGLLLLTILRKCLILLFIKFDFYCISYDINVTFIVLFVKNVTCIVLQVASEAGAYDILDNLCFTGLESPPNLQFSSRHERWSARHPAVPFYGEYV